MNPDVIHFFEQESCTFSYILKDPESSACAIIDSVLDFDYRSGTISYDSADKIISYINDHELEVIYILETHVHADHLSAAPYIQSILGGKIAISKQITEVQEIFGKTFNEGTEFSRNGSQFDRLLCDNELICIGKLEGKSIHTPGHTPACMTYIFGNAAFVGDTLFMPDAGTARADFPGGNARILFNSIQRVLSLPDSTRLFICHDYQPNGRPLKFETSVLEQKKANIHAKENISEEDFVQLREKRDSTLSMPRLIFPSLQANIRAGNIPQEESNEISYFKVPISHKSKL